VLKKIDGKLIQADHNPVKVGDNITIITNSSDGGGKPGDKNPKPKPPRGAPKWFQDYEMRNDKRLEEIINTLKEHGNRLTVLENNDKKIFNILEKHDTNFKTIFNILEKHDNNFKTIFNILEKHDTNFKTIFNILDETDNKFETISNILEENNIK
jgi:hypothetical protein